MGRPLLHLGLLSLAMLAFALTCAGPLRAAPSEAPAERSFELKVLSYNVRGLPYVSDLDRLDRIGEILAERRRRGSEPDVVLLQEAYVEESERLRRRAGYPHVVIGAEGQRGVFHNSSGLEVLSNFPIFETYSRTLSDCAFPECFVSKAVLGVGVRVPELPDSIQLFNTHLQAGTSNDGVRHRQIDDIATFLRWVGFGSRIAIFGGDFNFKPKHGSYTTFVRRFPFVEAGYLCLQAATDDCEVEIGRNGETDWTDVWKSSHDRHFYYQPSGYRLRIEPVRLIRNFTEKVEGEHLSDHWGYEVHYRISW